MCDDMGRWAEAFQLGPVAMGPRAVQLWLTAPESALWRAALQSRLLLNARLGRLSKNECRNWGWGMLAQRFR